MLSTSANTIFAKIFAIFLQIFCEKGRIFSQKMKMKFLQKFHENAKTKTFVQTLVVMGEWGGGVGEGVCTVPLTDEKSFYIVD